MTRTKEIKYEYGWFFGGGKSPPKNIEDELVDLFEAVISNTHRLSKYDYVEILPNGVEVSLRNGESESIYYNLNDGHLYVRVCANGVNMKITDYSGGFVSSLRKRLYKIIETRVDKSATISDVDVIMKTIKSIRNNVS